MGMLPDSPTLRYRCYGTWLVALLLLVASSHAATAQQPRSDWPGADDEPAPEEAPSGDEDFADEGVTGATSYESPQFGYTLEWGTDWEIDTDVDEPVLSSARDGYDSINLIWEGPGRAQSFLTVNGADGSGGNPRSEVTRWTSEAYIDEVWDPDDHRVDVVLDDSGRDVGTVVYLVENTTDNYTYVAFNHVLTIGDTSVYVFYSLSDAFVDEAFTALVEDIELDGEQLELQFTIEEIVEAIEGA